MENTAGFALTRIDAKRLEAAIAYCKKRWRRILLEVCLLAAFVLTSSLIVRG